MTIEEVDKDKNIKKTLITKIFAYFLIAIGPKLNEDAYKNNPNFTNAKNQFKLSFQPYSVEVLKTSDNKELFVKKYIDQRQMLYLEISERIWGDFWKLDSLNGAKEL